MKGGILGEDPLTVDQIQTWLEEPQDHAPLNFELPLGLAAGASGIKIPEDNPMTRAKIELGRLKKARQ